MSQDTAADREKARRSKSADAIAAMDAAEQGGKKKPAAAAPAAKKPTEKKGAGRDDSQANFDRLAAGLRAKIAAAKGSGNNALAVKLEARLAELRKTIQ